MCTVTFANTGKEMPETLDFVRDCGEHWGVDITWLELEIGDETADISYKNSEL
jgi:3'-phosphoadenosine 5'-phosphosulfate sulfotransferase (PAPS reductase)/FAD synthetase